MYWKEIGLVKGSSVMMVCQTFITIKKCCETWITIIDMRKLQIFTKELNKAGQKPKNIDLWTHVIIRVAPGLMGLFRYYLEQQKKGLYSEK